MSKHNNIHWIKQREYYRLEKYSQYTTDFEYLTGNFLITSSEYAEVSKKLNVLFYDKKCRCENYSKAPKYFRKKLNRTQRYKSKRNIRKILNGENDKLTPRYKGADYDWW
jgi:hypothetical protein